jgi:hypothetical protein
MGRRYLCLIAFLLLPLRVLAAGDCSILEFLSPTERMASDASFSENEKYNGLLNLLLSKGALNEEALGWILNSKEPLSPMDLGINGNVLTSAEKSVLRSAFSTILIQAKRRDSLDWDEVRRTTETMLDFLRSLKGIRTETNQKTEKIWTPLIIQNELKRDGFALNDYFQLNSGQVLLLSRYKGNVKRTHLVDVVKGESRPLGFEVDFSSRMASVLETRDGRRLVAANSLGVIKIVDSTTLDIIEEFDLSKMEGLKPGLSHGSAKPRLFEGRDGLSMIIDWNDTHKWLHIDLKTKARKFFSGQGTYNYFVTGDGRILKATSHNNTFDAIRISDVTRGDAPLFEMPIPPEFGGYAEYLIRDMRRFPGAEPEPWIQLVGGKTAYLINVDTRETFRIEYKTPEPSRNYAAFHFDSSGKLFHFVQNDVHSPGQENKLTVYDMADNSFKQYDLPPKAMWILKIIEIEPGKTAVLMTEASSSAQSIKEIHVVQLDNGQSVKMDLSAFKLRGFRAAFRETTGTISALMEDELSHVIPFQIFGPISRGP